MGGAMGFQEYRSKGAACVLAAESSQLPEVRAQWLAMAQTWFRLADLAEKSSSAKADDHNAKALSST
jgi:hypothetical protein